jgi:hypothetical protein
MAVDVAANPRHPMRGLGRRAGEGGRERIYAGRAANPDLLVLGRSIMDWNIDRQQRRRNTEDPAVDDLQQLG